MFRPCEDLYSSSLQLSHHTFVRRLELGDTCSQGQRWNDITHCCPHEHGRKNGKPLSFRYHVLAVAQIANNAILKFFRCAPTKSLFKLQLNYLHSIYTLPRPYLLASCREASLHPFTAHLSTMASPHIPLDNEEQAPKHRGSLSFCPQQCLDRIAKETNTPISSLATLLVKSTTCKLYSAILEYTALSAPLQSDVHHPLLVDSFDDSIDDSDDDTDEESEIMCKISRLSHRYRSDILRGGRGLRKQHVPIPIFKFCLGEATVVWPPPSHLTAEAIQRQNEQCRKRRKLNSKSARILKEDGKNIDVDGTGGADVNQITDDTPSEESDTIYIVHYAVGEPKAGDMGMTTYREITLVSHKGSQPLQLFTKGVLKWHMDKNHRSGNGSRFALHRFKMDRHGGGWWQSEGMKRARPPSSVILPKGQLDSILNDVANFVKPETKKWYISHGLQHRRAYLFAGPPGTGKTSTIRAIASKFRLNCCFLSMTNASFSNQILGDALSQIPANAMIVLEDVDALFNEDRKNEQGASLTFSGLLNALDGLVSADGVITVMTTNHIERLDKALIRGGRVDRRFCFSRPSNDQLWALFLSFYPGAADSIVRKFLDAVNSHPEGEEARSIATLQQLFIDKRDKSAEECANSVASFFESHFPNGSIVKKSILYT